jgi:hypothetical protein
MKFISEMVEDVEYLHEGAGQAKKWFIEGVFMEANTPNRNGRIYPGSVMENALSKFQSTISSKRAMGELGHPDGPQINLDRVSHLIESLSIKGNQVMGRARILGETPMGKIAQALVSEGVKIGVSSRGLGSLVKGSNGLNEVQNDFHISTVDIVADPSAPNAFVNGINESVSYEMLDDGRIIELVVDHAKQLINEEKAIKAFSKMLLEIKRKV